MTKKDDFTVVPVVSNFDTTEIIGELRIRTDALPPTSSFVFSIGYTSLASSGDGAYELVCISPMPDASYLGYLLRAGIVAEE